MLRLRRLLLLAAPLLQLVSAAVPHTLLDDHSFGHQGKLNGRGSSIPNWLISGQSYSPQLLSDRLVLTHPGQAHTRGAIWNEKPNANAQWSAELSFRANGQERGSGNIHLWYAKDGPSAVATNSIYTVTKFEGLVLIIDARGESGGMLRGFLDDGTINFKNHHMVDSLAFGFCAFSYRNLGRYSRIRVQHNNNGLRVYVDDQSCFSSEKVSLPAGYHFGITAATADNPDSFEVSKFAVTTAIATDAPAQRREATTPPSAGSEHRLPNAPEQLPDSDASGFKKQEEQFADLHNRLQAISHQLNTVFSEFDRVANQINEKHEALVSRMSGSSGSGDVSSLGRRLDSIEAAIRSLESRAQNLNYNEHFIDLHKTVKDMRGGLSDQVKDSLHSVVSGSGWSLGYLIGLIVIVQVIFGGVYYLYKRKVDGAPKKYL